MSMTSVFCDVDDFCLIFEPQWHKQFICNDKKSPVISKLTLSEIMTVITCFHQSAFRDFKHYYLSHIVRHKSDSFPNLVSYNRFVELMKTTLIPLTVYLKTQCMGKPTGLSFIDSTPIVVCDNHRINNHKVFREEAKRGKTSTGWKYGFKLHLIINHCGEILSFCLSTANTDDRKPVPDLVEDLTGWIYGDKGYISEKLAGWLKEKGLNLVTKVRKNMKPKELKAFDKAMLRKRAVIESVNDQLKNISQIEHTRHRSPFNFAVKLIAGLIAYTMQPRKPHINVSALTEGVPMAF